MALSSNTVWETRTTGSDTNGGGFVQGASGTDWSQQNAAQYALTNGVANGTATIATTSAAADMVGNIAYITGGTGSITAGWYQILSAVVSTSITVDRTTGLTAGTGVTINVGGALATFNALAAVFVSTNKAFIKATGTYQTATTVTFSAGQNAGLMSWIQGYTTTRGDGGQATLQMITNSGFAGITLSSTSILQNITVDCNSLGTSTGITCSGNNGYIANCKVKNYTSVGISSGSGGGNAYTTFGCEVFGGQTGATAGIVFGGGLYNNYVHDGVGPGIAGVGSTVLFNIVSNMSGATSDGITNSTGYTLFNTVYNSGRHGINNSASWQRNIVLNNILVNNGGFGIVGANPSQAQPALPFYDGNAYFGNTSGTRSNLDDVSGICSVAPYTNIFDVICTANPLNNPGSGDFSLNATTGGGASCKNAGVPTSWPALSPGSHPSMGAVQPSSTVTSINPSFAA